jgi:hypothetical protein
MKDLPWVYKRGWYKMVERLDKESRNFLEKGMYVAILEDTPFLEKQSFEDQSMSNQAIVIGVMNSEGRQ